MAQFSLSWDEYKKNICNGLSSLQQNGEFVDMTLAADGHLVRVHQLIMALASPYIKELISSANCPHPVIFLNRISYETLSALLEYIYTGEVQIPVERLSELIEAGRELHIKGLKDMKLQPHLHMGQTPVTQEYHSVNTESITSDVIQVDDSILDEGDTGGDHEYLEDTIQSLHDDINYSLTHVKPESKDVTIRNSIELTPKKVPAMQYTVSNQGRLQMILNRYLYYLKHSNRNRTQQWRCVDYISHIKCPAYLITRNEVIVQRISMHTHAFHDKKILKKVQSNTVYSALHDAEEEVGARKKSNNKDIITDDTE